MYNFRYVVLTDEFLSLLENNDFPISKDNLVREFVGCLQPHNS